MLFLFYSVMLYCYVKTCYSFYHYLTSELWKLERVNLARREVTVNNKIEVLVPPQICRAHFHVHSYESELTLFLSQAKNRL